MLGRSRLGAKQALLVVSVLQICVAICFLIYKQKQRPTTASIDTYHSQPHAVASPLQFNSSIAPDRGTARIHAELHIASDGERSAWYDQLVAWHGRPPPNLPTGPSHVSVQAGRHDENDQLVDGSASIRSFRNSKSYEQLVTDHGNRLPEHARIAAWASGPSLLTFAGLSAPPPRDLVVYVMLDPTEDAENTIFLFQHLVWAKSSRATLDWAFAFGSRVHTWQAVIQQALMCDTACPAQFFAITEQASVSFTRALAQTIHQLQKQTDLVSTYRGVIALSSHARGPFLPKHMILGGECKHTEIARSERTQHAGIVQPLKRSSAHCIRL